MIYIKKIYLLFVVFLYIKVSQAQNVGIGTFTPNAAFEVKSTTNGFLPPRLTIAQRSAITNPALGLVIFCSECDELEVYNGTVWKNMGGTAACVLSTLPYIKICEQIWMPKNLDVDKYRNGEVIPQVTDPSLWASLTTGAWCWYNNDSATYAATYGKLYNWYAVNDTRGLAPSGWHVPSDAEWLTLSTCLGGDLYAGGRMKEAGITHWLSPNTDADNSSGFTGLPGGMRSYTGSFGFIGSLGYWWSSIGYITGNAWNLYLYNIYAFANNYKNDQKTGFSVRCIRY